MAYQELRFANGRAEELAVPSTTLSGQGIYGIQHTDFGYCLIAQSGQGIVAVDFRDTEAELQAGLKSLHHRWPDMQFQRDDAAIKPQIEKMVSQGQGEALKHAVLHLKGTAFQLDVWQALLAMADGDLTDYSRIAAQTRNPAAIRAAASAVGDNPIAFLVPCHRVLRKDGGLGGYATGLPRKRKMLAFEATLKKHAATL